MSEPTYRIVVERREGNVPPGNLYRATIYRISDDHVLACEYGPDDSTALYNAQGCIAATQIEDPTTYYADEIGEIVPAPEPQSLRVAP